MTYKHSDLISRYRHIVGIRKQRQLGVERKYFGSVQKGILGRQQFIRERVEIKLGVQAVPLLAMIKIRKATYIS